jgi:hypothetical protein
MTEVVRVVENDCVCFYIKETGILHREDGPARIRSDSSVIEWYIDGRRHRVGGPAIVYSNGSEEWFKNGKPHRDDGPAVISEVLKAWYLNGFLHREDGPAVEWSNGNKEWLFNGLLHREDGPAIVDEGIGYEKWYINGMLHRVDGPAVIIGKGTVQWYLNNKQLSKEEWFEALNSEQKEKALYSECFIKG